MEHPEAARAAAPRYATIPLPQVGPAATHATAKPRQPVILLTAAAPVPRPRVSTPPPTPPHAPQAYLAPTVPTASWQRPTIDWWDNNQLIIRALAILGAFHTIIGAALLVMRFPEIFTFTPPVRVILGTLLGITMLAAAAWMRRKGAHPAAIGSVFAASAAIESTMALISTFTYRWIPEPLSLAILVALIAAYLTISRRWRMPTLTTITACILFIAALIFEAETTLTASLPGGLVGIALLTAAWRTRWRTAQYTGATLTILGILFTDTISRNGTSTNPHAFTYNTITLAALLALTHLDSRTDRTTFNTIGIGANSAILTLIAINVHTSTQAWICVAIAFAWAAIGYLTHAPTTQWSTTTALIWIPLLFVNVEVYAASASIIKSHMVPWIYLLVFAAAIAWIAEQREHWATWAAWSLVSLYMVSPMHSSVLLKRPLWLTSANSAAIATLLIIVLAAAIWHRKAIRQQPTWAALLLALLGLHYSTLAVVTITTYTGATLAGTPAMWLGYLIGHALISISWITASAWILLGHTKLTHRAELGTGITLAIAGTIKLVFFDMATLTGIPRTAAFLISGIVLLAIATRRGNMLRAQQGRGRSGGSGKPDGSDGSGSSGGSGAQQQNSTKQVKP